MSLILWFGWVSFVWLGLIFDSTILHVLFGMEGMWSVEGKREKEEKEEEEEKKRRMDTYTAARSAPSR